MFTLVPICRLKQNIVTYVTCLALLDIWSLYASVAKEVTPSFEQVLNPYSMNRLS